MSVQVESAGWQGDRVPAEHRLLGLDRRWMPHATVVLGLWLLWVVVVPQIDNALDFDDPVAAGEQMALSENVLFTPAVGWNVEAGHRLAGDGTVNQTGTARLVNAGVSFTLTPGKYDGSPENLLKQVEKVTTATGSTEGFHTATSVQTITTASGEVGVIQGYTSTAVDGLVGAFVIGDTGVEVQVVGTPEEMLAQAPEVAKMLDSIRALDAPAEGQTEGGAA